MSSSIFFHSAQEAHMPHQYTRQQLYDLVWRESMSALAKRLEISDAGFAKALRRANIPLPGRGYWAQREAGKTVFQAALPARGFGQAEIIEIGGRASRWGRLSNEEILNSPIPDPPAFAESLEEIINRARSLVGKVNVPRSLEGPHPVIAKLLEEDSVRRQKYKASPYPMPWDKPLFDSPTEQRRLRIVNALFLALARRGCTPLAPRRQEKDLSVRVGEQSVHFTLQPTSSSAASRRKGAESRLELRFSYFKPPEGIPQSWADEKEIRLEAIITDIVVGILVAGEWQYRSGVERRHEWLVERKQRLEEQLRQEELAAMHREQDEVAETAKKRLNGLLAETAAWRRAMEIRAYVDAVLRRQLPNGSPLSAELSEWAQWARGEADRIDPLGNSTK